MPLRPFDYNRLKESLLPMKRFVLVLLAVALLATLIPAYAQDVASDVTMDADSIMMLQINLIGKGYLKGEADGVMGEVTEGAIRKAQEDLGLPVTGHMTEQLSEALLKDAYPLEKGSRNSLVYQIQEKLSLWGYLEEEASGQFGSITRDAVVLFQTYTLDNFLSFLQSEADAALNAVDRPDDVVVDQPLISKENHPCDGRVTEDWFRFIVEAYELPIQSAALDDQNDYVKLVQKRLHALGYLYSGMDGAFGTDTEMALKYFQSRNGLARTGVCDEGTAAALFSEYAVHSDEYVMSYMAYVDRSASRVYIYGWDGQGYNEMVQEFECSCGAKRTPTIAGTFYSIGRAGEWYYMKNSNCWVRYAFQIEGNYFFHSVLFNHKGDSRPTSTSLYALGKNVSHGCIRLSVENCKWIYENCPNGMKVVIV